jgi:alpha-mannosidase
MRIHLIPNSHIDPVWLWDKNEGVDEVLNTFRSACDRMDEYPSLTFAGSSLQFYEWVLHHDPALFKRIKQRVAEGRWEVVGGWWVEADSNLPRESSFLKQAHLSQAFARKHFGSQTPVAYLPDSFGHPATLPKILAEAGFKYFVFCRPGAHEKPDLPANLFYWEYAGHRVLAYRLKHHYAPFRPLDDEHIKPLLEDEEYRRRPVNAFFFGVGNHGGGPTIAEIEYYNRFLAGQPERDSGYSTCQRFFDEAVQSPDIPTYCGDLHMHAVGCYSVLRNLKEAVRHGEHTLEVAARALRMTGKSSRCLDPFWKPTLFNQFHDILPGSCAPKAAAEACEEVGGAAAACRELTYTALKSLSTARPARIKTGELRVFNTLPYPVTRPISIETCGYYRDNVAFRDEHGTVIQVQKVLESVRCGNARWEFVDNLPARGFKAYYFDEQTAITPTPDEAGHFQPGDAIAMDPFRIHGDGAILQADKADERPLLKAPVQFQVLADQSDTWGHEVRAYDAVVDAFTQASSAVMTGPVTNKLYQHWTYGRSEIDVVYSVFAGRSEIYLDLTVNWAEDRRILKMEIEPAGAGAPTYTMEGPGGPIERQAKGGEMPMHNWVWVPSGGNRGLAILQDGAFACDCSNGRLRVTLVRSSYYSFHDPVKLRPADPQNRTDQGIHRFQMCWLPDQKCDSKQLERATAEFLEPYLIIHESRQA